MRGRPDDAGMRRALRPAPLVAAAALVVVLTWQAWSTARSHRATVDNALREYASFAAWQYARRASDHLRLVLWYTFQRIDTATLAQQPESQSWRGDGECASGRSCGAQLVGRAVALIDAQTGRVRRATGSWEPGEADRAARLVAAQARRLPHTILDAGMVVDSAAGEPRMLAYSLLGPPDRPHAIIAIAVSPRSLVAVLGHATEYAPFLPTALTKRRDNAGVLATALVTPSGATLVSSGELERGTLHGRDTLGVALGGLQTVVGIYPEAATTLIVGGVPRSRVPMLLAVLTITLALVGVAVVQMRRADEFARLRADFVAGVSHELRTPLTQISLFSDTLLAERERTPDERRQFLLIVSREAKRLRQLVDTVLHFATRDRRDGPLPLEDTLVAPEVDAALEAFAPLAEAKGMRFATALDGRVAARLNRDAFRQLLLNVLDNAVKFGPAGSMVRVELHAVDGRAVLSVSDEGAGIPESALGSVFEPFVRASMPDAPAVAGTGIGLAVVRDLVEQHRGSVRAENVATGGARFVIELPLAPLAEDAPGIERAEGLAIAADRARVT
jgi:signal transduction histidine kinase